MTIRFLADDLAERDVADTASARRLAAVLMREALFEEVVVGLDRVAVQFDPLTVEPDRVRAALSRPVPDILAGAEGTKVRLSVRYGGEDGPDLARIAEASGLSEEALIDAHTTGAHLVEMMGFTPGFAYLSGLDPRIAVTRLDTPRQRVAPGSVGVIDGHTGLYALGGPGGWPIIGRVTEALFDPDATEPFLLSAGMRVQFENAR